MSVVTATAVMQGVLSNETKYLLWFALRPGFSERVTDDVIMQPHSSFISVLN